MAQKVQLSAVHEQEYSYRHFTLFLGRSHVQAITLIDDLNRLFTEDYYLGTPGSKLFYRTTTKETQEKYHYSECQKRYEMEISLE